MYTVLMDGVAIHDPSLNNSAHLIMDGVVMKQVNKADSFSFTIYPDNVGYSALELMTSWISVYKDGSLIFHGRPLTEETGWDNEKKIVCEGDLAILNDTVVRPYSFSGTLGDYVRMIVNQHNAQVEAAKQIAVRRIDLSTTSIIRRTGEYKSTMQELFEKVVDYFGGYILMEYESGQIYISYLTDSTSGTNQVLEIGKNILSFNRSISSEALATALIPLGATDDSTGERLTIKSVNGGSDYIASSEAATQGYYYAAYTFDDITDPSELLAKARALLTDLVRVSPRIELSAVDLSDAGYDIDSIGFFQYVTVQDTAHTVSGQYLITERVYNISAPEKDSVTFGSEEKTISGQTAKTQISVSSMTDAFINKAVEIVTYQTDLLKGGSGGYFVIGTDTDGHPSEIYFLDTNSTATARSVLRINSAGIGFSTTGFAGPYTNAWTIDGQLHADFIKTGILSDQQGKNSWNLDTGEFHSQTLENAISQTEEGISLVSQKLNNIGGRNYLKYSNDTSTWMRYNATAYLIAQIELYANMIKAKKYTVTIWGDAPTRNGSASGALYSVYWGGGSVKLADITMSGGKGSATFTTPTSGPGLENAWINIYNTADGASGTFTYTANITAVKLEEGEVSTDWSAAPEDKTGNNEIISKINVSPENITISANKVDLQGFVTFTNLSTSGQTAINGGNITTNTISADKLSITDLNAIGATIGGFKIETNSIHTNGVAITSNATNSVGLSSSTFTRTINGTSRGNLKFAIGSNFGVANDGTLYASNGNFTGTITSNSATITGGKLNINAVTTFNASDYTSADVTRIRDYILEGGIPTMDDYTKYDIDRNGRLNISDLIKVRDLVNGEASSFTATSYVDIDPSQSNSVIHIWSSGTGDTQGTFLGAGLIQTNTVRTGDCWMNTQGVWLGSNNVRTGLLYPDSLNFFHSNGNNMMMLEGSSGLTFSDSSGNVTATYPADGLIKTGTYTATNSQHGSLSISSLCGITANNGIVLQVYAYSSSFPNGITCMLTQLSNGQFWIFARRSDTNGMITSTTMTIVVHYIEKP